MWIVGPKSSSGQTTKMRDLDKKSKSKYQKAIKDYANGDFDKSVAKLEDVVKDNPNFKKGLEKLAAIYLENNEIDLAIKTLDAVFDIGPNDKATVTLSYALEAKNDLYAAKTVLRPLLADPKLSETKKAIVQERYDEIEFREAGYKNPVAFEPIRFTRAVNTDKDIEYHPIFNADGSRMLYVSVTRKGKQMQEDLYYADRISEPGAERRFSDGQPIEELNTDEQEGAFTLSQDGNILIFTACEWVNSLGGCDLYISFRKAAGWTEARNMGKTINSRFLETAPTLSADGRTLYFASKRSGGHGDTDIWVTSLSSQNRWTPPKNLGPTINTDKNDEAPFIHPDNETLYFASEGHRGFGSYDVFMSRLQENKEWSTPLNLGYPINTSSRQGGLFVDLEGNRAYYSTDIDTNRRSDFDEDNEDEYYDEEGDLKEDDYSEDSNDEEDEKNEEDKDDKESDDKKTVSKSKSGSKRVRSGDIYFFDLPEAFKPKKVTYLLVKVIDAVTKRPLNAAAEIKQLNAKDKAAARFTTDAAGKVLSTIAPGEYAVNISKQNYLFHSEHLILDTLANTLAEPFTYIAELVPIALPDTNADLIPETEPVILKNIFFETGSATLLQKSNAEIEKLVGLLEKNENLKIKITGHTDNVGQESDNLTLSEDRAQAVYDALVRKSIDPIRLSYQGIGEKEPIDTNETDEGRQANRRTEFVVVP